jgi:hypothetical protein
LFLVKLFSVVDKYQDGSRTPGGLLEAAEYEYVRAGGQHAEPPTWSQLLGHIEKKAPREKAGARAADNIEERPYLVHISDLYAVRSALDRMKHLDLRMFPDFRQVTAAVMPTRTRNDVPTQDLTRNAINAVLLQQERNKERVRRGGHPEPFESPQELLEPPS